MNPKPALLLSVAIAAITAMIFSSASFGQQAVIRDYRVWTTIQTPMFLAVEAKRMEDNPSRHAADPVVKIGHPYRFEKYDWYAAIAWTGDLILSPQHAIAKRTFKVYDIRKINAESWKILRDAYITNPAMAAFLTPEADGYKGVPVKWTEHLANVMEEASLWAADNQDSENSLAAAVAGDIMNWATITVTLPQLSSTASGAAMFDLRTTEANEALLNYDLGYHSAIAEWGPSVPIYIALSETPPSFELAPDDQIITSAGYYDQPLGSVMPSWPNIDE